MIESPKARFIKTDAAKALSDVMASPWFAAALDATLLQMSHDMGTAQDMGMAAANQFRMEGARRFAATLTDLTTPTTKPKTNLRDNLET